MSFFAKKSLGQNFLHAPHVLSLMAHTIKRNDDLPVLEVGPGKGALTAELLNKGMRVIAVEKDERAIPFLSDRFQDEIDSGQLKLIYGDILELTDDDLIGHGLIEGQYKVAGNLPYYITGAFMKKFLGRNANPIAMVLLLQKEVAERIVMRDGKQSLSALGVNVFSKSAKYMETVPAKWFKPKPNVDSAVIYIDGISKEKLNQRGLSEKQFFNIAKAGFAHKRKVLISNLAQIIEKDKLLNVWQKLGLPSHARPEDLDTETWIKLSEELV